MAGLRKNSRKKSAAVASGPTWPGWLTVGRKKPWLGKQRGEMVVENRIEFTHTFYRGRIAVSKGRRVILFASQFKIWC